MKAQMDIKWGTINRRNICTPDTALLINNVPVAYIRSSGNWGWSVNFVDKSIPTQLNKYYAKQDTAMRNAEKRFGIHSEKLRHPESSRPWVYYQSDEVYCRFMYWSRLKKYLSHEKYTSFMPKAFNIQQEKWKNKIIKRKEAQKKNPKRRKALQQVSLRNCLFEAVDREIKKELEKLS